MHEIAFPALGIDITINRTALSIGNFSIMWYGVIIAVGFALAVVYCSRRCVRYEINPDHLIDMILWATPAAIIGARIYYCVFNWAEFADYPVSVFFIWEGGIALYGSLIFGLLAAIIYCKVKKVNFFNMIDLCILGFMIGQIIGRWGNFVNAEAYGQTVENWFLGMSIDGGATVHPIFLYESVWNLIGFLILHLTSKKRRFYGQTFLEYIVWYGVGRGFIEGIRGGDTLMLFDSGIRVSQLLGYMSALVAFGILIYKLIFSDRGDTIELLSKQEAAVIRAERKLGDKYGLAVEAAGAKPEGEDKPEEAEESDDEADEEDKADDEPEQNDNTEDK